MTTELTYDLVTSPNPLAVGQANSTLTIVASVQRTPPDGPPVIMICIPMGSGATQLADTSQTIAVQCPPGWSRDTEETDGIFTFRPPNAGDGGLSGGLVFEFSGITVNDDPGTATVSVTENNDANAMCLFQVSKFPADFALSPLTALPTEIAAGATATLSWSGSAGYTYELSPSNLLPTQSEPLNNAGSIVTLPLSANTIFTLSVSNGDNQNSFVTQEIAGVTVDPPTIANFRINDSTSLSNLTLNETLTLSWDTTNADHVLVLLDNQVVGFYASDDPAPSLQLVVGGHFTAVAYYGEISGGIHSPPSDPVSATLAPPTVTLTAPDTIYADYTSVTLSWSTQNATSATLQVGSQSGEFGVALNNDDYPVYPQQTTQYTLTATYDPSESIGLYDAALMQVPTTMLATNAQLSTAQGSGTQHVSSVALTTMKSCPLQIFYDEMYTGKNATHSLDPPATDVVSFLGGFYYFYKNSEKHNLRGMTVEGDPSLNADGTTVTVASNMTMHDKSSHNLSSSAMIYLVTICWNDADQVIYTESTSAQNGVMDFTYPVSNYTDSAAGMTHFGFGSFHSDEDSQVSALRAQVDTPDPQSSPNTTADSVDVNISYSGTCKAENGDMYYSVGFSPILARGSVHGSGFGVATVSNGTLSVSFPQNVVAAHTFLARWQDDGNGDNHTVQYLMSLPVTAIPDGQSVSLVWGTALWNDGKNNPWNAKRTLIVLAEYGDTSLNRAPS